MIIENLVITCILFDDKQEYVKCGDLDEKYFDNKQLFKKVLKYRADNLPFDFVVISKYFTPDEAGIFIQSLNEIKHISFFENYYRELCRQKLETKLLQAIKDNNFDAETIKKYIGVMAQANINSQLFDFDKDLITYTEDYEQRLNGHYEKYRIGLEGFDEILGYFKPKMFYTIGGRSGSSKTNVMLKIMGELLKQEIPCLYLTSEMSYGQIIERFGAMNSGLRLFDIINCHLTPDNATEYIQTLIKYLSGKNSRIYEGAKFDIVKIKELIDKTKTKFVFVDYLQKFNLYGHNKNLTRAAIVSDIASDLKSLAMEKNVIVIAASQLKQSSDVTEAGLSDIKESGGIEENSDGVILLSKIAEDKNFMKIKIDIAKNKYGISDKFVYLFNRSSCDMYYSAVDTENLKVN